MDGALRLVNVVISVDAELLHLLSLSSAVRQRGAKQLYNNVHIFGMSPTEP